MTTRSLRLPITATHRFYAGIALLAAFIALMGFWPTYFGRLLEGGVSLYLETLRPTQPVPVWTSIATGKYPPKTGVRAAARYEYGSDAGALELLPDYCFSHALVHFGLLRTASYEATALRARPLWSILSGQRVSAGVVGWPVTAPASWCSPRSARRRRLHRRRP